MTQPTSPEAVTDKIPERLPVMPLFDSVLFPKMVSPVVVMQPEAIRLVDEVMSGDRMIGFVLSREKPASEPPAKDDLYTVGTNALILKMARGRDNTVQMLVQGVERFTIREYLAEKPYLMARVALMQDVERTDKETQALMSNILGLFEQIIRLSPGLPQEMGAMAKAINEPGTLGDMVTSIINAKLDEKQGVLETADVKKRLKKVNKLVNYQLEILKLGNKIQTQVKGDLNKSQRNYYLRQQLKAIQEELGEGDQDKVEIEEYKKKIEAADLPEEARKEADRELERLARMHPSSAEYTVAATYLDWITSLPWHTGTPDNLDIKKAGKILDEDHFGLDKAKRRVIEYLAVRKLKPESRGPILCFAGPPGTGKTSLGRSIARALGRKFYRISLGGVRDEAEIRGHRRTDVGALPGRI
ncbi:MAG: endopeptidase La, partial [Deltaproteobacteria bacterium]